MRRRSAAASVLVPAIVCSMLFLKCTRQADLSVAVVGAGIGGTSCAHFLRDAFGNSAEIDVYEGGRVGGRLATAVLSDGNEYETGGSVIHRRNKYMSDFVVDLGLEKRLSASKNERLGLYNGKDFDFVEKEYYLTNLMSVLWRYGYSVKRLQDFIDDMLNKFDRIYELQSNGKSFNTTYDLLSAMDPSFVGYLNVSVRDAYLKQEGLSESLVNELVQASLRVNYGQNTNVHQFVGSVSMAGMDGSLWAVKGGNKKVAEKLLEESKARLIPEYVSKIIHNEKSYTLLTKNKRNITYDYVVFAAPLALNQDVPIVFSNMPSAMDEVGKYHRTVSTLVVGDVKKTRFSPLSEDPYPFAVISNNDHEFFNSVSNIESVHSNSSLNVWKVFSQYPLSSNEIDELFESTSEIKVVDWLAYPRYQVPTESQSFIIADRLYHINAIEWAASAMEMSCIGAKNVALLIKKHVENCQEQLLQSETTKKAHTEL